MATIALDTHKAVKDLQAAGASEDLATAIVRIVGEYSTDDPNRKDESSNQAQIRLALSTVELRITNRFAWISLGVLGGSIFCSVVMSVSLLSG